MKQVFPFVISLFLYFDLCGQGNAVQPTYVFEGALKNDNGPYLTVNMNFLVLLDSTIIGSYYYKPSNGSLKLTGRLNKDNSFTLVERNEADSITGYFSGNWAADKNTASGDWTSASKGKHYNFSLLRIKGKSYWDYIHKNRSLVEYTDLQLAIKDGDKVKSIDVASHGLSTLPKQLSKLNNIVSVNLLGNEFTSFPPVLGSLVSLDEISLSSNSLTSVGKAIRHLKNLRILILNNNQLTKLPKEIGGLTNLLYLEIGNNKLKSLPEEIKYLTSLQELHIERNSISESEQQRIKKLLPNCVIYF